MIVDARNLRKQYGRGASALEVLRGVDLEIAAGELVAIVGPSGAGKSTLLHLIGGLDEPTEGSVRIQDRDLYALRDRERARVRNNTIGFVFQFYHLLPEFTMLENTMLPALMQPHARRGALTARATTYLERMGLAHRLTHRPHELSGGELQRAAIARALINDPALLLCDEPTGNLDSAAGTTVMQLLVEACRTHERAVVLVSHDEALARSADRVIQMRDGLMVSEGRA